MWTEHACVKAYTPTVFWVSTNHSEAHLHVLDVAAVGIPRFLSLFTCHFLCAQLCARLLYNIHSGDPVSLC